MVGRFAAGVVILAVLTAAALGVLRAASQPAGSAIADTARVSRKCESRLLADWSDGRIDATYPVRCYRTALKLLPADLRIYSSAPDDIAHALSRSLAKAGRAP